MKVIRHPDPGHPGPLDCTFLRSSRLASASLAVALVCIAGTAAAQPTQFANQFDPEEGEYVSGRTAFEAADTDGDGLVSEAELARDAAAGFTGLDTDASGTLTPTELGPHEPEDFEAVDSDGDGELTFNEVMENKVRSFQLGDIDNDGGLTLEEMTGVVEQEAGDEE